MMNELSVLLSRKKQLLKQMEDLKRKQNIDIRNGSDSDIVENSDTEMPPISSNSCLRSQRNITVCSTDDEPSSDSINTSTLCLPLDHSFFQPYKDVELDNNACANNTDPNDASYIVREDKSTFQNVTGNSEILYIPIKDNMSISSNNGPSEECPGCFSVVNIPLEFPKSDTKDFTNYSATNVTENRQMYEGTDTNEQPNKDCVDDSSSCMTTGEKSYIEYKEQRPTKRTINIISDEVIKPPRKLEIGHSSRSVVNLEKVMETGLHTFKTGSAEVETSENIIIGTEMEDLAPCCSKEQDNFNIFSGDNNSNQEILAVVISSSITPSQVNIGRKKRKATRFQEAYMDFKLEEDVGDYSSSSSDNWSPKETDCSSSSEIKKKAKKKIKQINSKEESDHMLVKKIKIMNKTKTRKISKEKGLSYETITGKIKEARKMKNNPCVENKCPRKCYDIPEERRQALFNFFWDLDDKRKKEWIVQSASYNSIKRKRTDSPLSRRDKTWEYYINEGESRRQVCQQFLRNTLDISQTYLLYNLSNSKEGISQVDKRTRHAVSKYDENTQHLAKKYIEDLPVLPSHYSRSQSNRLYVPQDFKNKTNLYRLYVKYCEDHEYPYLSNRLFTNLFDEYNLSFHVPKKDKCKLCVKYENNTNILNEKETYEYLNHIEEKKACYKRAKIHRDMLGNSNDTVMASFDLQKVLNTPHGESMLLYYSRKYAVYDLTVYESNTQNGFCFTWGESDGKRGSCEIGTCLYKYLLDLDKRGLKYVIFYCDSCWGQNKNKVILTVFKYFLENSTNIQSVQVNYLLPGHTYMPVDSMHSVIEREVRKLIVWSPVQWPILMAAARKSPRPYVVNTLDHTDFINWENIANEIFTTKTTSDKNFRLKDIRIATIKKPDLNELQVKYTMKDDGDSFKILLSQGTRKITVKGKGKGKRQGQTNDQIITNKPSNYSLQKLYTHRLPISTKKYMDLKKLCDDGVIPKQYVQDYLQLPYVDKIDYLDDIIIEDITTNESENQREEFDECHEDNEINTKGTIKRGANKKAQKRKAGASMKVVGKGIGRTTRGKAVKKSGK